MNNHFSSVLRPTVGFMVLLCGLFFSGSIAAQPDGEKIFKGYCASCHKVDKDMTGPALMGVEDRWSGKEELLYEWIKNPSKVKAAGDPYVNELLKLWEPKAGLMTPQALTNEEIDAVLGFIASYVPPVADTAASGGESGSGATENSGEENGVGPFFLVIIALLLVVIILSMSSVRQSLAIAVDEQKGKTSTEKVSYWEGAKNWMWNHKVITAFVVIFFLVLGSVDMWDRLAAIGVYEGYAPEQPIAFNHTLHAGDMEINCQYCHSSAEKSKHAGIPSANVCMNCHKAVSTGRSDAGTADIQKIYSAVGWDPEKMAYTGQEMPIKWVKVHVLPDHVYFNHSQHVAVAGLECQTCHGPIDKEYTVAEQFAPLTMGWCIECHNQSEIDLNSSAYYEEMHKRFIGNERGQEILKKYLEDGSISVKDMGGWECSKCHY